MYKDITEIKKANEEAGHYFFSPDTLQFWGSKVYPRVYGGRYYITSEDNFDRTAKFYSVRRADERGHIETVWGFLEFNTLEQAKRAIEALLSDVRQEAGK